MSFDSHILVSVPASTGALRSIANDGRLVVTDIDAIRVIADVEIGSSISGIAISRNGRRAAAVGRGVAVVDFPRGNSTVLIKEGRPDTISSVALSPDGSRMALGLIGEIRLLDAADGSPLHKIKQSGRVRVVRFSPDGQTVLSAADDATLHIWDVETGRERRRIETGSVVIDADWSNDGSRIATGSVGGLAQIWSASDQRELIRITHRAPVNGVGFSADSQVLATASGDPTPRGDFIELHALTPTALIDQLCQRILSTLSTEEWRTYFGSVTFQPPCVAK